MKHRITAALERFSRAMLAPLSYLSAAGLLLVVGALLTSKNTIIKIFKHYEL